MIVQIRKSSYPLHVVGQGIPCIVIGIGSLMLRSLSLAFTAKFQLFSSDLYWVADCEESDESGITMETIVDDIKLLGDILKLPKYVILAHSAYGIVALEFAKKYSDQVLVIIMIGTPTNSNPTIAAQNDHTFQQEADPHRKRIDYERRLLITKENLSSLTPSERFLREYIDRDAPRYWYQPDYDCSHLWKDITLDKLIERFFAEILPSIDVQHNLKKVQSPIFLAAGMSDFDCCPWKWQDVPDLPRAFTISVFEKSGHWPHYEEPENFDNRVFRWIDSVKHKDKEENDAS